MPFGKNLRLLNNLDNTFNRAVNMINGITPLDNGTGLNGTGTVIKSVVGRQGDLISTTIFIDLTGLRSTAAGDIIGINGTSLPCYLTRVETDYMGTIVAGNIVCYEAPAGGDPDIDLYAATEGTGSEDDPISGLTGTQLVDAGDHTLGSTDILTAFPTDNQYLYLVAGSTTDADYTAGKLLISLLGYK